MIERYSHHGRDVAVRSELKGMHSHYCLCITGPGFAVEGDQRPCKKFNPGKPETNCPKANLLYAVDIVTGMTTPVFECPDYE